MKNTKIANTLLRLRAKPSFVESGKYNLARQTDHIEVNTPCGLYF